jgi:hypothetical protein
MTLLLGWNPRALRCRHREQARMVDTMSGWITWMRARTTAEQAALCVWGVILLVVSVRVLVSPASRTTYPIFSSSARLWWQGEELYFPYRPETVQSGYRYSPAFAILMIPFGLLPDGPGGALWRCGSVLALLAALGWWARAVLPRAVSRDQLALLALLIMPMALPSVNNGQANVLVTGLMLASIAAVAERRWNLASLLLGVAFACKIYPLALGLVLAVLYPRRLAARLLLVIAAVFALPWLCQAPAYVLDQYSKWLRLLTADDRSKFNPDGAYRDLWLLIKVFAVPITYNAYHLLQVAGGAVVAGVCWYRQRRGWPEEALLTSALALTTGWMLLLGPAPESCTFILLAPSLAWAGLAWLTPPQPRLGLLLILASSTLYLLAFTASWLPVATAIHSKGLHPWATLLWMIYLLQEKRTDPPLACMDHVNPQAGTMVLHGGAL